MGLGHRPNDAKVAISKVLESEPELADDIEALIQKRNAARAAKDFVTADSVRDQLAAAGIKIEDGAGGTSWRRGE